jgi:glutamine synthetase adenylyltransferase
MLIQSVIIDLPEDIYNKYKQRAEETQRTVEAEITETVANAAPNNDKLSAELEELVAQLVYLDDKHLERFSRSTFPKKDASKIESLHYKQQSEGLDDSENEKLTRLMKKLDRWFVLRNEAIGLLIKRREIIANFAQQK